MCLVGLSLSPNASIAVMLASNRDEVHSRPSEPAHAWPEAPHVFAGRDQLKGGTWMGVTDAGRYAAITNFRHPQARREGRSRGAIVRDYLLGSASPQTFVEALAEELLAFPSFNLIVGDPSGAHYLADGAEHGGSPTLRALQEGIFGLSNGRLDEPWPKVKHLHAAITRAQDGGDVSDSLFAALADRTVAADAELPATGVPRELERFLSASFLVSPGYGTRASTVLVIRRDGAIELEERSYNPDGSLASRVRR